MHKVPFLLLLLSVLMCNSSQVHAVREVPIQFQNGLVWVKVAVPGRAEKLNFLLDSGAGVSVIDSGTARQLGVQLGAPEQVQGVNGSVIAHQVNRFAGNLSGVSLPRQLLALDLSSISAVCRQQIDGLLGADFFRDRIVQIDFSVGKLRLLSRGELNTAGCESLPLVQRRDALCTRVSVEGGPAAWMRVDTGCDSALRWVVSSKAMATQNRSSIGVAVESTRYLKTDVQLGSLRFQDVKTGIHRKQIFPGESGLLGNGLLSRFTVTFDAPGKRLLLQPR